MVSTWCSCVSNFGSLRPTSFRIVRVGAARSAVSSRALIASLNSPTPSSLSPDDARRNASIFDFESATPAQPFTSSLNVLPSPLLSSFAMSALNFALLFGWVSPTTSLPPFLKSSQTTSTSGPSAGFTSCSKLTWPDSTLARCSNRGAPGNLRSSPSALRHCRELKSVLSAIRTGALAGTTFAAAGRALPPPPPPPQPAATRARPTTRDAAPARIALLDLEEGVERRRVAGVLAPRHERPQRPEVVADLRRQRGAGEAGKALAERDRVLQVDINEPGVRARQTGCRLRLLEVGRIAQFRA